MPVNNNLKPRKRPVKEKWGKEPETEYVNLLKNIRLSLVQAPSYEEIRKYFASFATATYEDSPFEFYDNAEKHGDTGVIDRIVYRTFKRQLLPATMETIKLNFLIEGISIQEVTHILRYRKAAFSAECSGEKWWSDKKMVVPTSIENSNEFYERYKTICDMSKKLYADMVDSKEISIRDARYILPRATETFYFMSMDLGDALHFINDRIDCQIQPLADNVLAYQMLICLLKQYPILVKVLGKDVLNRQARFYTSAARNVLGSNMYPPDRNNDVFEYNEEDFIYNKTRENFNGVDNPERRIFEEIKKETELEIEKIDKMVDEKYGVGYFEKEIELEEIY